MVSGLLGTESFSPATMLSHSLRNGFSMCVQKGCLRYHWGWVVSMPRSSHSGSMASTFCIGLFLAANTGVAAAVQRARRASRKRGEGFMGRLDWLGAGILDLCTSKGSNQANFFHPFFPSRHCPACAALFSWLFLDLPVRQIDPRRNARAHRKASDKVEDPLTCDASHQLPWSLSNGLPEMRFGQYTVVANRL